MRIALDISPMQGGKFLQHRVRGTGFYTQHLKLSLEKHFPDNEYTFFIRGEKISKPVDIIHYPYFEPFFLTLPFQRSTASIVTVHDLTPIVFPDYFPAGIKGRLKWLIQNTALHTVSGIIADSLQSKKDIVRFTGINENKIHVVYLAAGEQFKNKEYKKSYIDDLKRKYNLPNKFVLYVGDVTWNKNLPKLIKALANTAIPLVMVGKALIDTDFDTSNPWNQDRMEVQKLASENKNIIRIGFVPDDDLVGIYNIATVFVMPSIYEGFGLPLLEAMACGCPVLTSRGGSIPEVVGDAADYVNADSVESIAESVQRIFEDTKRQKELREKGYSQVKKFAWEKTAAETVAVYKNILGNKSL